MIKPHQILKQSDIFKHVDKIKFNFTTPDTRLCHTITKINDIQ